MTTSPTADAPRVVADNADTEQCARCGSEMTPGTVVVDVDTDAATMPYATAEWATVHADPCTVASFAWSIEVAAGAGLGRLFA